jgi:hypothetical protein
MGVQMRSVKILLTIIIGLLLFVACGSSPSTPDNNNGAGSMVVLGYNDLGMHCINQDFSELLILPLFNNLYAQVIRRGEDPQIVTSGVTVNYAMQGNTHSADKSNFWTYEQSLGVTTLENIGLTGNGLSGAMALAAGRSDWLASGIPITPIDDSGALNPYPLALITVNEGATQVASTQAVVPVSWEISCNLCHNTAGISTAIDILRKHDQLHGTSFEASTSKPIVCGECHRQEPLVPLGLTGNPDLPSLSRAMHGAHVDRMDSVVDVTGGISCYACHPGLQTQCLRDVHFSAGLTCYTCHTSMEVVAAPTRRPWIDEPRCGTCHTRAGFEFEQPDTLYRNSVGHMGVHCEACHGSPHAIVPTNQPNDNVQAIALQGHAGTINTCIVCHTETPDETFPHSSSGGGGD